MTQVSARLASLSPSATLAMSQKSSELKAQGVDVINLSVGEPDFNTPEPIKEAAKKAIEENYSRYSPVAGYPALRNAIVAKLKNENGLEYTANQISCANGAKQSVCNTIMVLINQGDEVIIPAPFWVSYPEMVKLAEGIPVIVTAGIEQDFKITPAQLEAAITPKTKALILCSPSNPTGSVYNAEELEGVLTDVLQEFPVRRIALNLPKWMRALDKDNRVISEIMERLKDNAPAVDKMKDAYGLADVFNACSFISAAKIDDLDMGRGVVNYALEPTDDLFFQVLSEQAQMDIVDEFSLMSFVTASAYAKNKFDAIKDALDEADANGYGIVYPNASNMTLDEPQMVKQGNLYGVRLKATSPSYHIVKVNVIRK